MSISMFRLFVLELLHIMFFSVLVFVYFKYHYGTSYNVDKLLTEYRLVFK